MRYIFSVVLFLCFVSVAGGTEDRLLVGDFSGDSAQATKGDMTFPTGWEPLVFDGLDTHTLYTPVRDGKAWVIRAESRGSSSGLVRKMVIDPAHYGTVNFRWKIEDTIPTADLTRKDGDDAPARLYITFAYDSSQVSWWEAVKFQTIKLFYGEYPPIGALMYVWASQVPKDTLLESPYTERVKIIVLQSGGARKGQWLAEQRNILDDYRLAFAVAQVPLISGVAIMTDTDNTDGQAVAWYGDIIFSK